MNWICGVTTVHERKAVFEETLRGVKKAGFPDPYYFRDDEPRLRPYGNWLVALLELWIRNPTADRYAVFQDDVLFYSGVREYLDSCAFPDFGYWNLYTAHVSNEDMLYGKPNGWHESALCDVNNKTLQVGKGALALVFSREGVLTLLTQRHVYARMQDSDKGHLSIDGAVVHSMNMAGWKEYIHKPTLVQHMCVPTTIERVNRAGQIVRRKHVPAHTWKGEDFDARSLISAG